MFCCKCGQEIKQGAKFCPKCGSKQEEITPKKNKKKKQNKNKKIFIPIVAIFLLIMIFVFAKNSGAPTVTDDEIRLAVNNFQNNGEIAVDEEWIYYVLGNGGLNKFHIKDGTKEQILFENYFGEMFSLGGYLYSVSGGKFNIKESTNEYVEEVGSFLNYGCIQTDSKYYYTNSVLNRGDEGVYRVKVNNGEDYEKLMDLYPTQLILQGRYLYVMSAYDTINNISNEYKGTWKYNLETGEKEYLFEMCPRYFIVDEYNVYYTDSENRICSMRHDGEDVHIFEGAYTDRGLNISDEYIFYIDQEAEMLHRMNKDGTEDIVLCEDECSYGITIAGDNLIYCNSIDNEVYKMNFDGTIKCALTEAFPEKESVNVEEGDDEESDDEEITDEVDVEATTNGLKGMFSLEEMYDAEGFYIMYDDNSFDRYYGGNALTWDDHYMTYGMDYRPRNLVMSIMDMELNASKLKEGQLVLFWSHDYSMEGIYPVCESGYTLFRYNEDYKLEGLFYDIWSEKDVFIPWTSGKALYWSNPIEFKTVNGIDKEEYTDFPQIDEERQYTTFEPNQTYIIGTVEGTTLIEKEYKTDHKYFVHESESVPFELTPTADGYAIVNLDDLADGEYVFTVSYWDEEESSRKVRTTYLSIN